MPCRKRYVGCLFVLIVLSLVAVVDHGEWTTNRLLWRAVGFDVPPASAYYWFNVKNDSDTRLLVSARLMNDRRMELRSPRALMNQAHMGRLDFVDILLEPDEEQSVLLTSPVNPSIGLVLISAVSPMREGARGDVSQLIAMKMLSWEEITIDDGKPTTTVAFSSADLLAVDRDSIKNYVRNCEAIAGALCDQGSTTASRESPSQADSERTK